MRVPSSLQTLMTLLKRLPGVGPRSAERYAFALLGWDKEPLAALSTLLKDLHQQLHYCDQCGALAETTCHFCSDTSRNRHQLCVVAHARDVCAFEETRSFRGLYHVLGGVLNPMERRTPATLRIESLRERLRSGEIQELILALDTTLEGDATALFLRKELESLPCHISRLAFGLPMGSSLEYIDGSTLSRALAGRQQWT